MNFKKLEKKIREFWQNNNVFERLMKRDKSRDEEFVFYEGPPFANGIPGIHHVLARAFKDAMIRFKTMEGYRVPRKAGWDTHGLPSELEAEKKLGITNKKEIEKKGVDKFVNACEESVFLYIDKWHEMTKRMGYWLDLDDAYITCSPEYIENVWGILKRMWDKDLFYQDYKVIPYCPRCGTTLSSHEVAQGYNEVEDTSVFVKFKIQGEDKYLLAWTTTPWTLTANVALAVNKDMNYVEVKDEKGNLILAESKLDLLEDPEVVRKMKGKELLGLNYEPIFESKEPDYEVFHGDFVGEEEGTGIVHIAPAFGEEDMNLGKKENLPILITMDEEGKYNVEGDWKGKHFEEITPLVVKNLKERGLLFDKEEYSHEYPFCWRCDARLMYYPKESWFIKMSDKKVKKRMIENNQEVRWKPSYLKDGRFGNWLEGVQDWVISRERYWGTPLPIWECDECEEQICIGNLEELTEKSGKEFDQKKLHRPYIDKAVIECPECGGKMHRVEQVLDCWFDSGSMPLAQNPGLMKQDKEPEELVKEISFPADFICEGIDQTRGWFYSLLAISTALGLPSPYKSVIGVGMVLDADGKMMSKSKGNTVEPLEAFDKYGADSVRWYFYRINEVGKVKRFDPKRLKKEVHKLFRILLNTVKFFKIYSKEDLPEAPDKKEMCLLDKWIVNRQELTIKRVKKNMDDLDFLSTSRELEDFILDMSQWYLRRSRNRLRDSKESQAVFLSVLKKTARMIAPFAPFIAERIYQDLGGEDSVHLADYPSVSGEVNEELLEGMKSVREICEKGRFLRRKADISIRQPLSKLVYSKKKVDSDLESLICKELNVKKAEFKEDLPEGENWVKDEKENFALNIEITKKLKEEGIVRNLNRKINYLRKKAKLSREDKVNLVVKDLTNSLERIIKENIDELSVEKLVKKGKKIKEGEIEIEDKKFGIKLVEV